MTTERTSSTENVSPPLLDGFSYTKGEAYAYKPNRSATQVSLAAHLLPGRADSHFCDVTLVSSDGETFPAARILLMNASPFFFSLLSGPFVEATASRASLDVPSHLLRDVLHFVYLDESPIVRVAHDAARATAPIPSRPRLQTLLNHLVELATAADYLQLERLVQLAARTVECIGADFGSVSCYALSLSLAHGNDALRYVDVAMIRKNVLMNPTSAFGTPENKLPKGSAADHARDGNVFTAENAGLYGSRPPLHADFDDGFMVHDLSLAAWECLFEGYPHDEVLLRSDALLIALQVWACDGPDYEVSTCPGRVAFARTMVEHLDAELMSFETALQLAPQSVIVSDSKLREMFRGAADKACVIRDDLVKLAARWATKLATWRERVAELEELCAQSRRFASAELLSQIQQATTLFEGPRLNDVIECFASKTDVLWFARLADNVEELIRDAERNVRKVVRVLSQEVKVDVRRYSVGSSAESSEEVGDSSTASATEAKLSDDMELLREHATLMVAEIHPAERRNVEVFERAKATEEAKKGLLVVLKRGCTAAKSGLRSGRKAIAKMQGLSTDGQVEFESGFARAAFASWLHSVIGVVEPFNNVTETLIAQIVDRVGESSAEEDE